MDLKRLGVSIDPRPAQAGARAVDRELQRIGDSADRNLNRLDRANRKAGAGGRAAGADMAFLQAQSVLAAGGLGRAAGAMGAFGAAAAGAVAALAPLLAVLLPIIAAVKVFSAVVGAAKRGVAIAGEIQRLEIALTALTGSSSEASRVIDELRQTALNTGVAIADQARTVQKFIALGFSTDDAIQLQKNILDVAGAVGLTSTEANLLGSALAQVQAKGVVSMEELRQQIAEKGIPAIEELQRKTGLFGEAFFKAIADGEVPAQDLIDIFLNLEGSFAKFEGGAERIAQSIPGQLAVLQESFNDLLLRFGQPIADAIGPIIQDLINIIQSGQGFAERFGQLIGDSIRILYQAISDGTLEDLLATTFLAGVESGLNFLANGFVRVVGEFGALLVSAIEFGATKLGNLFKSAFAGAVNFFAERIETIIQAIVSVLQKAADIAVKVSASAGKVLDLPPVAVPGSGFLGRAEPSLDERSFGDILAGNRQTVDFASEQLKDPFGSFFNDRAAGQAQGLLDKSLQANPRGSFTFEPEATPAAGGELAGGAAADAGKAGTEATKKTNEELEKQLGIVDSLKKRLGELATDWGNVGRIISDIAEGAIKSFSDNLATALTNIATGAQSAGAAFRDMANAVIQSIIQMIIQMTIQLAVAQALTALGVPVGALSAIGGAANAATSSHAGTGNGGRVTSNRGFSKFHNGGTLSSENLALTDQNETILTRRRAEDLERELASARETSTPTASESDKGMTIVNVLDQNEVLEMIAANPDVTVNAINRRRRQVEGILKQR